MPGHERGSSHDRAEHKHKPLARHIHRPGWFSTAVEGLTLKPTELQPRRAADCSRAVSLRDDIRALGDDLAEPTWQVHLLLALRNVCERLELLEADLADLRAELGA